MITEGIEPALATENQEARALTTTGTKAQTRAPHPMPEAETVSKFLCIQRPRQHLTKFLQRQGSSVSWGNLQKPFACHLTSSGLVLMAGYYILSIALLLFILGMVVTSKSS